jgi:hypothetical protein
MCRPARSLKPARWEAGELSDRVGDDARRDVPALGYHCDVLATGAEPLDVSPLPGFHVQLLARSARLTSRYFIAVAMTSILAPLDRSYLVRVDTRLQARARSATRDSVSTRSSLSGSHGWQGARPVRHGSSNDRKIEARARCASRRARGQSTHADQAIRCYAS